MSKRKIWAALAIKGLCSVLLIWLLLRQLHLQEILGRLRKIDLSLFILAVTLAYPTMQLAALRWKLVAGSMLTFREAAKYTWIGIFYGAILPGSVSGDVGKGASLAMKNPQMRVLALPVTIVIDRLIGVYALLLFFNVGCALIRRSEANLPVAVKEWAFAGWLLSAAALLAGLLLVLPTSRALVVRLARLVPGSRLRAALNRLMEAAFPYLVRRRPLLGALAVGCASHALSVVQYVLMLQALQVQMSLAGAVAFYSIVSVAVLVPVSISGVGVRDWVSLFFFGSLGLDGVAAVAFSWLQLAGGLIVAAAGGLVQVWELWRGRLS